MSYLIDKFLGKYRLLAPIDEETGDFPKDINGKYEDIDVYIACKNDIKVFYYGDGVLEAYIPSITRGNRILEQLDKSAVLKMQQNEGEMFLYFRNSPDETILSLLNPLTRGASISPFDEKNKEKIRKQNKEN